MAQMIVELIKLASLIITINKSIACAERVESVLEIKSGMTYPKEMDMGQKLLKEEEDEAVRFRHVTFSYEGAGAPSLMDISFGAKKGQTVGIIGGTGSGKTSLISLIPRFYDVDEGCVEVNGRDVREYPAKWLTDRIGVVPQKAMLFSGSIRDNLKWGKEQAEDTELMEAATIAQAKEVILGKPEKLDFMLEQNGRNLSGGQRQRLTIARALVKRPDILILDDSASALDFTTDAALRKAIQGMRGKMTVFLISQRASSIRYADIILVMEDGQLAGQGTHEELMRSCRTYQEIYYSQYPDERPPETDRPEEGKARQREANGMPEKGGQV
jgi:ABC-type multidrug transport system fused ATPase/permease subunit